MDIKGKNRAQYLTPSRSPRTSVDSDRTDDQIEKALPHLSNFKEKNDSSSPFTQTIRAFRDATNKMVKALQKPTSGQSQATTKRSQDDSETVKLEILRILGKQLAVATEWQAQGKLDNARELLKSLVDAVSSEKITKKEAQDLLSSDHFVTRTILLGDEPTYRMLTESRLATMHVDGTVLLALVARRDVFTSSYVKKCVMQLFSAHNIGITAPFGRLPDLLKSVVNAILKTNDIDFCVQVFGNAQTVINHALSAGMADLALRAVQQTYQGIDLNPESDLPTHLAPPPKYSPS